MLMSTLRGNSIMSWLCQLQTIPLPYQKMPFYPFSLTLTNPQHQTRRKQRTWGIAPPILHSYKVRLFKRWSFITYCLKLPPWLNLEDKPNHECCLDKMKQNLSFGFVSIKIMFTRPGIVNVNLGNSGKFII